MIEYPASYPKPIKPSYSYIVDMGVSRAAIGTATPLQTRLYNNMPNVASLTFAVEVTILKEWLTWVNQFAHNFFTIKALLFNGGACIDVYCRFSSDINMTPLSGLAVSVTVEADLYPIVEPPII